VALSIWWTVLNDGSDLSCHSLQLIYKFKISSWPSAEAWQTRITYKVNSNTEKVN